MRTYTSLCILLLFLAGTLGTKGSQKKVTINNYFNDPVLFQKEEEEQNQEEDAAPPDEYEIDSTTTTTTTTTVPMQGPNPTVPMERPNPSYDDEVLHLYSFNQLQQK